MYLLWPWISGNRCSNWPGLYTIICYNLGTRCQYNWLSCIYTHVEMFALGFNLADTHRMNIKLKIVINKRVCSVLLILMKASKHHPASFQRPVCSRWTRCPHRIYSWCQMMQYWPIIECRALHYDLCCRILCRRMHCHAFIHRWVTFFNECLN